MSKQTKTLLGHSLATAIAFLTFAFIAYSMAISFDKEFINSYSKVHQIPVEKIRVCEPNEVKPNETFNKYGLCISEYSLE